MLSEKSRPIIEATLAVVAERMPHITPEFYRRMFAARPDLMDGMFSRSSQLEGTQPQALAGSVVIFADYIFNNPDKYPDEVLSRVAHKHASLGLQAVEYTTVYKYLFEAIAADLGDACTPEVAEAWSEVYWLMGNALINIEKGLYASQANDVMHAPFRLIKRVETGDNVVDMTFEAANDVPLTPAKAGQYVSLIAKAEDGLKQARQYTLLPAGENQRRIASKLDPNGEMTKIHHALKVGDIIQLSNPYGDITLGGFGDNGTSPLYLFSAGIGITPMIAFLDEMVRENSTREVVLVHSDRTPESWPLREEAEKLVSSLQNGKIVRFFEESHDGEHQGRLDITQLDIDPNAMAYLCGPLPFMKNARSQLIDAGIPGVRIQYEIFGPDQWMLRDTARAAQH
ncbi:globin domain-containing protein [Rothia sp. P7181]|uniref:globin domain-containing protein n=1 Tax=unclassified Rothia (in: high G+C Gram-positive bacteria) TaxID=2689056 RepID=UPI003AC0F42B